MPSERSALAQFWSGILPLDIQIHRYANVKLEDNKTCKVCKGGVVEDEFHLSSTENPKKLKQIMFQQQVIERQNTGVNAVKALFDTYPRKLIEGN